jgi:hypothetical protein
MFAMRFRVFLYPTLICLLLLAGCGRSTSPSDVAEKDGKPFSKQWERGPLSIRLHLDKTVLDLSDHLILRLEAECPEGIEAQLPELGEGTEQFLIVNFHALEKHLTERGTIVSGFEYVLEPLIAEKYIIPALTVKFIGHIAGGSKDGEHELSTESQSIQVELPPPEIWDNLKVDDVTDAEPLPLEKIQAPKSAWLGLTAIALIAIAAILIWKKLHKKSREDMIRIPPHEAALEALQRLVDDNLIEAGNTKLFYIRISNILREYLEAQFNFKAPERTTQEFLEDLRNDNSKLSQDHKSLLQEFLTHCDLVKFARHQPDNAEIQATFDACRDFILETTPKPNSSQ